MKNDYEAPSVTELGRVEDLTQGFSTGNHFDQAFTVTPGTPVTNVFS